MKNSCRPLIKFIQGRCVRIEPVDLSEATGPDGVSTARSVLLIYIAMSGSGGNWCSARGRKSFRKYPHVWEVGEEKTTNPLRNTHSLNTMRELLWCFVGHLKVDSFINFFEKRQRILALDFLKIGSCVIRSAFWGPPGLQHLFYGGVKDKLVVVGRSWFITHNGPTFRISRFQYTMLL